MDAYTRRTREWLDAIYEGPPGVPYTPHSPVHGFDPQSRYIGTYCHLFAVLRELSGYDFRSCLEVGSGEGFLAAQIRRIFGTPVVGVDLSHRVCRRAAEYSHLPAAVCEALHLPFADQTFDLVVSINTLEHIADVEAAWAELRRVARGVVLIGMPHATGPGQAESEEEPHAHVSLLTQDAMRRVFGARARVRGSLCRLARPLYALAASDDVAARPDYAHLQRLWARSLYRLARALGTRFDRRQTVAWLARLEDRCSRRWPAGTYESIVVAELDGVRRRREPLSPNAILAELLR